MVQSAESGKRSNLASSCRTVCDRSTCWCVLRERQMCPVLVVVTHVLGHQTLQMSLVQDDHMVQQVSSATSHPTLRNPVLPGTSKSGAHRPNSDTSHERYYVAAELCIMVKQKEPVRRRVRPRFPHLLHDPKCTGVSRDVETENLARS